MTDHKKMSRTIFISVLIATAITFFLSFSVYFINRLPKDFDLSGYDQAENLSFDIEESEYTAFHCYRISGWIYEKESIPNTCQIYVLLDNRTEDKTYKIATCRVVRPDIAQSVWDTNDLMYRETGFTSCAMINFIKESQTPYKILLAYSTPQSNYYVDTGKTLTIN